MATKTGTKGSQTFARCLLLTAAALGIVELVLYLLEGRTSFDPNYSVYAIVGMGLGIALGLAGVIVNVRPLYFLSYLDSGLQMATTVYYEPTSPTEKLKDDINSRVKRALDSNGIEIPYNYITITSPPEKTANNKGGENL